MMVNNNLHVFAYQMKIIVISQYIKVQYNMILHINGLVQDCSNSISNALELLALSHQYNPTMITAQILISQKIPHIVNTVKSLIWITPK